MWTSIKMEGLVGGGTSLTARAWSQRDSRKNGDKCWARDAEPVLLVSVWRGVHLLISCCSITSSCRLVHNQHPVSAIKPWFIALTRLTRFLTITVIQMNQETEPDPSMHLTCAERPRQSVHIQDGKSPPYHLIWVQPWSRKYFLQMDPCGQTEFPPLYITALNNECRALKSLAVSLRCCLCSYRGTVRVTRAGQCSDSHTWAVCHPPLIFQRFVKVLWNMLHVLASCRLHAGHREDEEGFNNCHKPCSLERGEPKIGTLRCSELMQVFSVTCNSLSLTVK